MSFISEQDCHDYIIFKDFNVILNGDERWRSNGFDSASDDLVGFVESLGVLDLPLQGSHFTYFNSGASRARSHLDKFLISGEAGVRAIMCHRKLSLDLYMFDHIPIV